MLRGPAGWLAMLLAAFVSFVALLALVGLVGGLLVSADPVVSASAVAIAGPGSGGEPDARSRAGPEASPGAGSEAGPEAGSEAGSDAPADAGRRFWVKDKARYSSAWYRGAHRRMINYGCTRAPYYAADPQCAKQRGFHHGVDIAMRCGTPLYAAVRGRVVRPRSAGALGAAYGAHAFRLRNPGLDRDIVIGHTRRVFVRPGDRVRAGQRIARASDQGAPDGCHLHLEVRPTGAGYLSAVDPERLLRATRRD